MKITDYIHQKLLIIGPCSLESKEQMKPIMELSKKWGINYLRAPLFKPRTSAKSFQGLGESGLGIIEDLEKENFSLVTEALSEKHLEMIRPFAGIIQIGARNMQNFELLKTIGLTYHLNKNAPFIMLKRGFGNYYNEWLSSANYLSQYGVPEDKIILCERGTRNSQNPHGVTLDFAMAIKAKAETNYKVIIDPSHGSNDNSLVLPLTQLALSSNLDGVMIEIHPDPKNSVSDPQQAITPEVFEQFLVEQNT